MSLKTVFFACLVCFFSWQTPHILALPSTATSTVNPLDYTFSLKLDSKLALYWNINAENDTIDFGLIFKGTGWVGFGPTSSGGMKNADSWIGWIDKNGNPELYDYHLGGKKDFGCPNGVCKDTDLGGENNIISLNGSNVNGVTHLKFIRPINTTDKYDLPINPSGYTQIIWAYTKSKPGPNLDKHNGIGILNVNFWTGQSSPVGIPLRITHGTLMFVAWGILIPASGLLARSFKKYKWWFRVHWITNVVAVCISLASFIIAVIMSLSHFDDFHKVSGLIVVIGSGVQPILGKVADYMYDPNRKSVPFFPDILHWILGWALILFGLVTILTGLLEYGNGDGPVVIAFSIWFGLIVVGFLSYFLYSLLQTKKIREKTSTDEFNLPEQYNQNKSNPTK